MHLGEWTCMRVVVCSLQILCWICIFMFDRSPQEGFIFRQLYNLEMSNSCFMHVWLQHWTWHEPFSRMCLNVNVCGILVILLSNSMCSSENAASPGIHWACSMQHAFFAWLSHYSLNLITNDSNIAVARLESSPFWLPNCDFHARSLEWLVWCLDTSLSCSVKSFSCGTGWIDMSLFLYVCCLFFAWYLWMDEIYWIYLNVVDNAVFYSKLIKGIYLQVISIHLIIRTLYVCFLCFNMFF